MAFLQGVSMIIASLIILYTIPSTTSVTPDPPTMILINGICQDTVNPSFCEQSILPTLDQPHAEITTIAKIAAFNAVSNSKKTVGVIRDEFLPGTNNPLAKAQLRTCLGAYHGVVNILEGAYRALLQNNYSEMRRYQSSVLGILDSCKTEFGAMDRINEEIRLYINISIFAARTLPSL